MTSNQLYKYSLLLIVFLLVLVNVGNTQENSSDFTVKLAGKVMANDLSLFGAKVFLYDDTSMESKLKTSEDGAFYFDLNPNKNYKIVVSKEGYLDKELKIKSNMVMHLRNKKTFEFSIELKPHQNIAQK